MLPALTIMPAGHTTHVVTDVAPVEDEYFPAGQVTHGISDVPYAAVVCLYLPAMQAVHAAVLDDGPSYPTLHEQSPSLLQ